MSATPKEGDVVLAKYRLVRRIGRGPHGEVFEAEQLGLDRLVAIKIVTSEIDRKRLARVAKNTGRLDERMVVRVLESQLDHDPPFLVSELARGVSLASLLAEPIGEERATLIARSLLDALSVAHENGIFHGDLRPPNIFVDGNRVQISDFGFAVDDTDEGRTATELLSTKAVVGYRAPERIRGAKPDARADLFAVGVCLFEMLAGRRPFESGAPVDEVAAILRAPTPQLRAHCNDVISRALDKDPTARFASAQAMKAALGRRRLLPWFFVTAVAIPIAIAVWASLTLTRIERAHTTDAATDASAPEAAPDVSVAEPVSLPSAVSAPLTSVRPSDASRPFRISAAFHSSAGCAIDAYDRGRLAEYQSAYDACLKGRPDVEEGQRYVFRWEDTTESEVGRLKGGGTHGTIAVAACLERAIAPVRLGDDRHGCEATLTVVR